MGDHPGLTVKGAIEHWESKTSYRFHALDKNATDLPANRVNVSAKVQSCQSEVGMGGVQTVDLGLGCLKGPAIHEIGHVVRLWHEQSRNDRRDFVSVQQDKIEPEKISKFCPIIDPCPESIGTDLGFYDYGSIMHYGEGSFTKNGRDTIITIPPGIPIGQREGLSQGDIDAAERLDGVTARPFVVTTNSPGLDVVVAGVTYAAPSVCIRLPCQKGCKH